MLYRGQEESDTHCSVSDNQRSKDR